MCVYMWIHVYMYACECNRSSLTLVIILIVFTQYPLLHLLRITPLVSLFRHSLSYVCTSSIISFYCIIRRIYKTLMIIHLLLSSLNSANVTAGVIGVIAVLLIVVTAIAVIIVIVIVCIIKCNRKEFL